MTQKEYPTAVVLKNKLIIIAIIAVILMIVLILHNLYSSTQHRSSKKSPSSNIQIVANGSDTAWYHNQLVKKSSNTMPNYRSLPHAKEMVINDDSITPSGSDQLTVSANNQTQQNLIKAMSAAIGSNQLTNNIQQNNSSNSLLPNASDLSENSKSDADANGQSEKKSFVSSSQLSDSDYLGSALKSPLSPYELQAGTIIPGILITGINSDLPGQITGQVRSNVYDSISGNYLLIPQGAKLTGLYDSQVAYGQERVLVVWKRIIFPNGQSIDLEGMPGVDMSGYSGFKDRVNNHYERIFGSVLLMSVLSAGAQLAQPQNSSNPWQTPTVGQTMAQSLGTNLVNTGTQITAKNLNIQPTLEIRPGYEFNITITKDMVFPGVYND